MAKAEFITTIILHDDIVWSGHEAGEDLILLEDEDATFGIIGSKDQLHEMLFRMMDAITNPKPSAGKRVKGMKEHGKN